MRTSVQQRIQLGLCKFFRSKLLRCETTEQTQELLNQMDRDIMMLKEELIRLTWHMRGGITYSELFCFSEKERNLISKLIKENLETTNNSGLPFF